MVRNKGRNSNTFPPPPCVAQGDGVPVSLSQLLSAPLPPHAAILPSLTPPECSPPGPAVPEPAGTGWDPPRPLLTEALQPPLTPHHGRPMQSRKQTRRFCRSLRLTTTCCPSEWSAAPEVFCCPSEWSAAPEVCFFFLPVYQETEGTQARAGSSLHRHGPSPALRRCLITSGFAELHLRQAQP